MIDGSDQIYQGGDGTALRFFSEPAKNNFQSERAGRAVFDTVLYCEVITPGSTESIPRFEVERTLCDEAGKDASGNRIVKQGTKYAQYVQQVEAFKAQNGQHLSSGTPITQWAQIDVGTAASLKAAGIHTVEHLASVQDGHLQNLGTGGRVMRDQAIAFLNARQFGVPTAQMAAETANLRDEHARVVNERDDLRNRLNAAMSEIASLRSGTPVQGSALSDPLGSYTPSQPNPGASLTPGTANPLTPPDAEKTNEQYKQQGFEGQQGLHQQPNPQQQAQQFQQPPPPQQAQQPQGQQQQQDGRPPALI